MDKEIATFGTGCGWPSFDEEHPDSLKRLPDLEDPEQSRTSIPLSTTLSVDRMGRRADWGKSGNPMCKLWSTPWS